MAIPANSIVFLGAAVLTIGLTVWHLIQSHRRPEPEPMAEAIQRVHKIGEAFERLSSLEGKAREALGRQITQDIRDNCETLMALIDRINYGRKTRDSKARNTGNEAAFNLSMQARREALRVYWQARCILFLFRFRPSLVRDCHRLAAAAVQHGDTWKACFRFLRAQYPEELGRLTIPE